MMLVRREDAGERLRWNVANETKCLMPKIPLTTRRRFPQMNGIHLETQNVGSDRDSSTLTTPGQ